MLFSSHQQFADPMFSSTQMKTCVLTALAFVWCVLPGDAGQRRFAYNYETTTSPKGSWEIENWVTLERSPLHDNDYDSWFFRNEVEYGVTDHFQIAVYVANWDFAPRGGEEKEEVEAEGAETAESHEAEEDEGGEEKPHRSARYGSSGVELIYNLTNPNTDWLGSAVYAEANFGDRFAELEGKILLQKNFGPLAIVYNAIVEFEWEGAHLEAEEIEFAQTFGVSYQVHPNVAVGSELVHEIAFPDFNKSNAERAEFFAGPNVTFHGKNFFVTASALWRTTDNSGAEDMQARVIVGFEF
jgi:hypothetical protein